MSAHPTDRVFRYTDPVYFRVAARMSDDDLLGTAAVKDTGMTNRQGRPLFDLAWRQACTDALFDRMTAHRLLDVEKAGAMICKDPTIPEDRFDYT